MPTITINGTAYLVEGTEPTNYGGEVLTLARAGKRGGLLAARWLAVRAPDGTVSRFRAWL